MTRWFLLSCLILYCDLIKNTYEDDQLVFKSLYDNTNDDKNLIIDTPLDRLSIVSNLKNMNHFNEILDNILIPRVVGTPGHSKVRDYIVKSMRNLNWQVELDDFTDQTPKGELSFSNIIATLNPQAKKYLLLACHYDSKFFENQAFLGASDSAVPCAMMINLAYVLNTLLANVRNNDISLKLVFFDGEEAFVQWTAIDSIYGSRHLAAKWENEGFLPKIEVFMLLDLLGAPDPYFYSFFKQTEQWYARLSAIEEKLDRAGLFERYAYSSAINKSKIQNRYFQPHSINGFIEDDHIPFLKRGVPIIHMIPTPFPDFWHKMSDDRAAIDLTTVENLNKIIRVFVLEYLRIRV